MHLRNLRVFCDVVRRNSFSRAAADHQMTQSGVSQAVQQLEEGLQVKLIDRSKRPFLLTAEGKAFHVGCLQILSQFDKLTEEVRSLGSQLDGRVSIAAIYSIGLGYQPHLQRVIGADLPKAQVRYHPDEVYRMVEQGLVDFGLVSYPESSKSISVTDWCDERMMVVAPPGHRLSQHRNVQPSDLTDESLVAFAPNLRIRLEIDRYLRHLGVSMQIAAEFDNIDSVKHALEVNSALAFLPEPAVRDELSNRTLVALDCPWLKLRRPLGLIQRKGASPGPTARSVIELILRDSMGQVTSGSSDALNQEICADNCLASLELSSSRSNRAVEQSTAAT